MDNFCKEFTEGEIHFRDKLQFELKTELSLIPSLSKNTFTQDFYLFIPNVLQISSDNYSKSQFYRDQTNLIRYKTPEFTFKKICDNSNEKSPLTCIKKLLKKPHLQTHSKTIKNELKLLANIVRSALRKRIKKNIEQLIHTEILKDESLWNEEISIICQEIRDFYTDYEQTFNTFLQTWNDPFLKDLFKYTEEFIDNATDYYLTGLLSLIRKNHKIPLRISDQKISEFLLKIKKKCKDEKLDLSKNLHNEEDNEFLLYRKGLLNKFFLDILLLKIKRKGLEQRYGHLIAAISAGIAMLFYLIFFIWQGQVFVINSAPFVFITVFLYILKDRLKDSLKVLYRHQAFKWFPDYTTEIYSNDIEHSIGSLKESFSFVSEKNLSKDIIRIRNRQFHNVLETFKRPETIIHYKKKIVLKNTRKKSKARRHELNNIFRFNVHQFLQKASNAISSYTSLNPDTLDLEEKSLPKVYHLNIIMISEYFDKHQSPHREIKKFRIIIDKDRIKRIEYL